MIKLQLQYRFDVTLPDSPDIKWSLTPDWMIMLSGPTKEIKKWYTKYYAKGKINKKQLESIFG